MSKDRDEKGRIKPGFSGNPSGWSRGLEKQLRSELRAMRVRMTTKDADGNDVEGEEVDGFKALFQRLWSIAMSAEARDSLIAIKLLYERTYGLPKQKITLTDDDAPSDEPDWSVVPVERRRQLFETLLLVAPDSTNDTTEH